MLVWFPDNVPNDKVYSLQNTYMLCNFLHFQYENSLTISLKILHWQDMAISLPGLNMIFVSTPT